MMTKVARATQTVIAAPSVSLEGSRLWILKEAPLAAGTVLRAKAAFQLLLAWPCVLLGTAGAGWGLRLAPAEWGALLAAGLARLLPLERPVSSYLAEQVDGMIQLEFSRALSVSAGTAWGLWLIFVGLSVAALKKSSRKFEKKSV